MAFSDPAANLKHCQLSEGLVVADFGAGSGAYALALARVVGSSGRVYAIDVQKELLARLKREIQSGQARGPSNIEVIWGDLERAGGSKLKDRSVDFVLLANILFQVNAKYSLILEAKRILKPDGRLAVIDWQDSYGNLGPTAAAVVSPAEAKRILAEGGFKLIKEFSAGDHHYGLLFSL
ncbi:MAG: methyltransferase domain-containing protein [Patescibacteria group bacterium]